MTFDRTAPTAESLRDFRYNMAESLRDFRYKTLKGIAPLSALSRLGGIAQ